MNTPFYQMLMEQPTNKTVVDQLPTEIKDFYNFHGIQLLGSKFPVELITQLHHKITHRIYDAQEYFKIFDNQDADTFEVHAVQRLKKNSQVFLIDHASSFRYPQLRTILESNPALTERLDNMTKYSQNRKSTSAPNPVNPPQHPLNVDLDSTGIKDLKAANIPKDTICLSLMENGLEDEKEVIELLEGLKDLKALWIQDNPVSEAPGLIKYLSERKGIELVNRKLTSSATEWVLKFVTYKDLDKCKNIPNDQVFYLNLQDRGVSILDFSIFKKFPNLRRINLKQFTVDGAQQVNQLISLAQLPSLRNLQLDYETQLVLFDVFKTGKLPIPRTLLVNSHSLTMDAPTVRQPEIDRVHSRIWKLTGCYRLASTEKLDETSIWYINDEFGSAFTHSEVPEVVFAPFLFAKNNKMDEDLQAFTILWTVKDLKADQIVERDYLCGLPQAKRRQRQIVWYDIPKEPYIKLYQDYERKMQELTAKGEQTLEQIIKTPWVKPAAAIKPVLKVLTDSTLVTDNLKLKQFELTKQLDQADIVWVDEPIGDEFDKLKKPEVLTNQFPFEACLVLKNNLARTVQGTLGNCKFLQRTYDLEKDLPIFIGHYLANQSQQKDNIWISKPPNMARSMDMLVSDNLDVLIRNIQTGPKLVQKYITNPVKRLNRKIDLRFIVLIRSVQPLQAYLYRHFWIRTSNNEYNTDIRFREDYQTHFTVMNYGKKLTQVMYPEFIEQFNKDYPVNWSVIHDRIRKLLRLTLLSAQISDPQMHSETSRAMYGVDIMIDEDDFEPKLLQFTFSPDCVRACKFYPTFFGDVFEGLFLDRPGENLEALF